MDTTKITGVISYTEIKDCIEELERAIKTKDVQLYISASNVFDAHLYKAKSEADLNNLLIGRIAYKINQEAEKAGLVPPPPPKQEKEEVKPEAEAKAEAPAETHAEAECHCKEEEKTDEKPSTEPAKAD